MTSHAPTHEEWRDLYDAADAFKAAAPWNWMEELDIFGVTNPETGEVGYCSIMGMAGEHFALSVYEGTEGLQSFLRIEAVGAQEGRGDLELLLSLRCLMASFEDRGILEKEDLTVTKSIGRKYRGRNEWPMFRRVRPYRLPSAVRRQDVRFLTLALREAVAVAERFRQDPELLGSDENPTFLVRVPQRVDDRYEWIEERHEMPAFDEPEPVPPYVPDDLTVERIRRLPVSDTVYEASFVLMPMPIEDEKKAPYYPFVLIVAEPKSQMLLCVQVASPWDYAEAFGQAILKAVETSGQRPGEIRVGRAELYELLSNVSERCGISLAESGELEALDHAMEQLLMSLGPPE